MKVSGFSFVRDAIKYDFPIIESIKSVLPICDEFVIAVGKSSDGTLQLIKDMGELKIKIVETEWDDSLKEGGRVLAAETDKALSHLSQDTDWAIYIQGDEVIPEQCLSEIYQKMDLYHETSKVDGLLLNFVHFYGSYDYVGASHSWYKKEIRVIKNNKRIYSYRDAQGFRKGANQKLNVVAIDATVYHYGWVKHHQVMNAKLLNSRTFYDGDVDKQPFHFEYEKSIELSRFQEEHPSVMKKRIEEKNWDFYPELSSSKRVLKDKIKDLFLKYFGIQLGYRNYKLLKHPK